MDNRYSGSMAHPPASLSPPTREFNPNAATNSGQGCSSGNPGGLYGAGSPAGGIPPLVEPGQELESNVQVLKAQLKLVTQERDLLKKDAIRQQKQQKQSNEPFKPQKTFPPLCSPGANPPGLEYVHHIRTASDSSTPVALKNVTLGGSHTLARSHSIAASGHSSDKNLASPGASSTLRSAHMTTEESDRYQEIQILKKKNKETSKRLDQAVNDTEYLHQENENLRARLNEIILDKQRVEQEYNSFKMFMEDDRKELTDLRRQQQELMESNGGDQSLSIMYGNLLRNYESNKEDITLMRRRYDDLANSHSAAISKLEEAQDEIGQYKKLYQEILTEKNQFKQQCTQAIRQWDQALRERNDYKEALAKVQRQHDEAVKEVNQAMTVRIKASKDLKRLTEERNAAMQEYSLIMSERDAVHKEIEKLQEEVVDTRKKMADMENKSKVQDDEKRKQLCQIEMLRREIEQALYERDKALKESHELGEKLGCGQMSSEHESSKCINRNSKYDTDKHRKDRDFASSETLNNANSSGLGLDGKSREISRLDNLDQAKKELERLSKHNLKLRSELQDACLETDVAKGRRDWAFTERDKVVLERESIRTLCDKLRRERDRAVSDLAEALRDSDDIKKERNEIIKDNKDLRERLETLEKELRRKNLQRSPGHSHSNDSAIDSDLQEWETENLEVDMNVLGSTEDLGFDLSGGRDDIHVGGGFEKPVYVSAIEKGSLMDGKLRVNDCIMRVNDIDCRDIERSTILNTLRNANSSVTLMIKRKKFGRRHQTTLHLGNSASLGLTLDLGVYVAKIHTGSVAAKEGTIAVGDRILNINDHSVEHVDNLAEALRILNICNDSVTLTLAKSTHALSIGPLSSSSSGHNLVMTQDHKLDKDMGASSKNTSSATSPIKDTIKGSQEFVRKILNGSSSNKSMYQGLASSSSSEKVYNVSKPYNLETGRDSKGMGTLGLIETVKEKLDNVRGRKRSKDITEMTQEPNLDLDDYHPGEDKAENAIATLDSVLDLYPSSDPTNPVPEMSKNRIPNTTISSTGPQVSGKTKKRSSKENGGNSSHISHLKIATGGTWPRTKGGPIIDQGTGTILHPHKVKKERVPIKEMIRNIPKFPPEKKESSVHKTQNEVFGNSTNSSRESRSRRSRPLTTYELSSVPLNFQDETDQIYSTPVDTTYSRKPARKLSNPGLYSGMGLDVFNPDSVAKNISPDNSVKSANAEKEVLEKYLRKSNKNSKSSDLLGSSSRSYGKNASSGKELGKYNTYNPYCTPTSYNISSTPGSFSSSPLNLVRPNNSGFSPYYNSNSSQAPQVEHSLPKYTSALPAQANDINLGSPIPDYRDKMDSVKMYNSIGYDPSNYGHHNPNIFPPTSMDLYQPGMQRYGRYQQPQPQHPVSFSQSPTNYISSSQHYQGLPEESSSSPLYSDPYLQSTNMHMASSRPSHLLTKEGFPNQSSSKIGTKSGTFPRKRRNRKKSAESHIPGGTLPNKSKGKVKKSNKENSKQNSLSVSVSVSSGTEKEASSQTHKKQGLKPRRPSREYLLRLTHESTDTSDYDTSNDRANHSSGREAVRSKKKSSSRHQNAKITHLLKYEYDSSSSPRHHPDCQIEHVFQNFESNFGGKPEQRPSRHRNSSSSYREELDFTSSRKNTEDKRLNNMGWLPQNTNVTTKSQCKDLESEHSPAHGHQSNKHNSRKLQAPDKLIVSNGLVPIDPPDLFKTSESQLISKSHSKNCGNTHKKKRLRNRSLEMVLDENYNSNSSLDRENKLSYTRSLERSKNKHTLKIQRIPSNYSLGSSNSKISSTSSIDRPMSSNGSSNLQSQFSNYYPYPNTQSSSNLLTHLLPYGSNLSKSESPLPSYSIRYLMPDGRITSRHQDSTRKPLPGDTRIIDIEKTSEQMGITIEEGVNKGIFVSSVTENSLATLVGLQVGDQLLDVCGINLRICGKETATRILHQMGNSISMKVQYNPDDFRLAVNSDSEDENRLMTTGIPSNLEPSNRSGSPTPRNSPKSLQKRKSSFHSSNFPTQKALSDASNLRDSYKRTTLTRHQAQEVMTSMMSSPPRAPASPPYESRIVYPTMKKSGDLGVRLVGGNAVGIFIHSVEMNSAAYSCGLRSADQILEYNNVDLRQATAEQAAYELAKPAEKVQILVQYNPDKYNQIKDQPGDSFYVRSMFDRHPESSDPPQLAFCKDDIIYVDNTMYNGVPGHWSAWIVDMDGKKTQWGIVPSKYKVEEELLLKRSTDVDSDGSRRSWSHGRSSFFKRKKKSGVNRSAQSKELASFSDVASLSYSDSGNLHEPEQLINSYIRVERLDYLVFRPVLIIGPLADAVLDKLVSDYPHKYARCEPKYANWSQEDLEREMLENNVIDFKRRGSHYECTTVETIRDICDRNQHCILNIHLDSVERLHLNQIYPIVLLIKFKTVKQIKEVKVPHFHAERLSQKDAKNIFEHTQKLESEYKHLISDTINAGANLMLMCTSIASAIDQEQNKTLWVPSGTIW